MKSLKVKNNLGWHGKLAESSSLDSTQNNAMGNSIIKLGSAHDNEQIKSSDLINTQAKNGFNHARDSATGKANQREKELQQFVK
jgi:hypothetical protein